MQENMTIYQFQSTSTMVGSGSSYSATPKLNVDGTAAYSNFSTYTETPAPAPSGPRKASAITGDDDGDMPIGDGTWILMLLAIGYALFIALMKKRERTGQ